MTGSDLRRRWRQYKADQEEKGGAEVDIRVALAGSMTVEPLEPYLGAQLLRRNFKPSIIAGPFNQLRQICSDPRSTLGRDDINVIVLLWRIEDLFPDMLMHCLRFPGTLSDLLQEVRELVRRCFKAAEIFHRYPDRIHSALSFRARVQCPGTGPGIIWNVDLQYDLSVLD